MGDKNNFSRTMDLSSQTLLVDCFHNFIEVSPLIFSHSLTHLKCTMSEVMKKNEINLGTKKVSCVSQSLTVCSTYSQCLPILFSLIQKQSAARSECQKSVNEGCFCGSRVDSIHVCHNLYRSFCCLCMKTGWGIFLILWFASSGVSLSFEDSNFRR